MISLNSVRPFCWFHTYYLITTRFQINNIKIPRVIILLSNRTLFALKCPVYKGFQKIFIIQTRPGLCVYTKYSFGFCTKSYISLCTFQAVHNIFRIFSSKIVALTATRLYDIIYCQLFIVHCVYDFPQAPYTTQFAKYQEERL